MNAIDDFLTFRIDLLYIELAILLNASIKQRKNYKMILGALYDAN